MATNDFELTLDATPDPIPEKTTIIDSVTVDAGSPSLELETVPAGNNVVAEVDDNSPSPLAAQLEESLSEEQKTQVMAFYPKIDLRDPSVITTYGAKAQTKLGDFSNEILKQARTKDLGTVGDVLVGLVADLEDFTPNNGELPNPNKWGFKRKLKSYIKSLEAKYDSVADNVEKAEQTLRNHLLVLTNDQKTLVQFDEHMMQYLKNLTMYIVAGHKRLQEVRDGELAALFEKAAANPNSEEAIMYETLKSACDRFEKKLHDLALSRQVAIQTCYQSRIMQNNDIVLIDKINSTLVNTIPLWRSQMVISLGIANSLSALEAQRKATDMTNRLLTENSKNLRAGTVALAKENERGIVDIETLVKTNQDLIATITEVQQIQTDGRTKRRAAEAKLVALEKDLKNKLVFPAAG